MNRTMTWKAIVTFCTVSAVGLWGCGGSGGGGTEYHRVVPDGYSAVSFTAGAIGNPGVQAGLGVLLDYTATGTGSGTGVAGPTSITDAADVNCAFTADATTTGEGYEIITSATASANDCANANECIWCVTTATDASNICDIVCDGTVPSSAEANNDTFMVKATFTSSFSSDMPDPYGTLRFDATRTAGTTDSFYLGTEGGNFVGTDCDGGGVEELGLTEWTAATWFTDTPVAFSSGYKITDVGAVDVGTNSTCVTTHRFDASASLGASMSTGGTAAEIGLGTVTLQSTICDDQDATITGESTSDCQPVE